MKRLLAIVFNVLVFTTIGLTQNLTTISVEQYGANGVDEADDTPAFQKAIDYLASQNGGVLQVPHGTYHISHLLFTTNKYNNISIIGDNATIKQIVPTSRKSVRGGAFKTFAQRTYADGCFLFDAKVSKQKDDSKSIRNIHIKGLRFLSDIEKNGFDELLHQISAHGVSNFTVEECEFIGFLGDGIAINAGPDDNSLRDAYNKDVKIKNCTFDGINKNNRQCISIYYSDGFEISNCTFKNSTRSDMPGAIDIEPDNIYSIARNGIIKNCSFSNIGGNAAIMFVLKPSTSENEYSNNNFEVANCSFEGVIAPVGVVGNSSYKNFSATTPIIKFKNSSVTNTQTILNLVNAYGIQIQDVNFTNVLSKTLNVVSAGGGTNIAFKNCSFNSIQNPNGLGFTGDTKNISFVNCTFSDFSVHGITINKASGLGTFSGNRFLSTRYKGGYPLVIPKNTSANLMKSKTIKNNTSKGGFSKLSLAEFIK